MQLITQKTFAHESPEQKALKHLANVYEMDFFSTLQSESFHQVNFDLLWGWALMYKLHKKLKKQIEKELKTNKVAVMNEYEITQQLWDEFLKKLNSVDPETLLQKIQAMKKL